MSDAMELERDYTSGEETTSPGGVPAETGDGKRQPVDLTQFEEFRRAQSKFQKQISELEYRLALQAQETNQYRQQLTQQQLAGMDDTERLAYERDMLARQLQEVERQRQLDAFAMQRQRDFEDIHRRTGVPVEELEAAKDVHEAWLIADEYRAKNSSRSSKTTAQESAPARVTDDRVDLGRGKPPTPESDLQRKYDAAAADYNLRGMLEAAEEARLRGVQIKKKR